MLYFFALAQIFAQGNTTSLLYEHETSYGFMAHTRGIGASLQFTKHRSADNFRLLDFNFYSLKHPKEVKLPNPNIITSRAYVFGKLNNFYALKMNYGARRILADKYTTNAVRLNLNYSFGPVLGIVKPVYYDVKQYNPDQSGGFQDTKKMKFDEENADMQENIVGTSGFMNGLGETKFMFGANIKTSLSFEWGHDDDRFYSLETGMMVDAFPKDVPIFAYIKNDQAFLNLFLTLSYGTRR
ncbi:MAG: hypothetical protein EOP53_01925 [Sphingobacteriales bacterium]|nr:MAG: hypothetical protein EOP53_01925 [Sphingobacteriales bacterium]